MTPPQTVALQAPLSMGFSRQECWSRLPVPSPGDLPNQGIEPVSPAWQVDSLSLSHLWRWKRWVYLTRKPLHLCEDGKVWDEGLVAAEFLSLTD